MVVTIGSCRSSPCTSVKPELDRGRIGEVAQARFAGIQFALRSVCLTHEWFFYFDIAEFNPDRIIVLAPVLDVGLDDPLFIDHFLKIVLSGNN